MKKVIVLLLACLTICLLGLFACGDGETPLLQDGSQQQTQQQSLGTNTVALMQEETYTLTLNEEITGEITWSSSKPEIATVEKGVVAAIGVGGTVITAKNEAGEKVGEWVIIVNKNPINDFVFNLNEDETGYILTTYVGTATSVEIPSSYKGKPVVETSEYSFDNAPFLREIYVPKSIKKLRLVYDNPGSVEKIYYAGTVNEWIQLDKALNYATEGYELYIDNKLVTEVNISGIDKIPESAFAYSKITKVTIGNSVTSIGRAAFYDCSLLESIDIPSSVTKIGAQAFSGCSKLTGITFKDTSIWYETTNGDYTGGTVVDVTNATTNADNLTSAYYPWYYYKVEN